MSRLAGSVVALLSIAVLAGVSGAAHGQESSVVLPFVKGSSPVIDGVWTSSKEWADASVTMVNYTDGSRLAIRGMHDEDSVYLMLEMPDDNISDGHAAVCFDTQGDGGTYMEFDDHCFVLGTVLKEYNGDGRTTLMQQTALEPSVVAQRGLSDSKSPLYSAKSHLTYEFKVPHVYLGSQRSQYGFYITFDTRGQDNNYTFYYSWPDFKTAEYLRVVSPRSWATLSLSADANVPEFPIPVFGGLAAAAGIAIALARSRLSF